MINEKQVHKYCSEPLEKIENYASAVADETQMWDCHHRGEVLPCGFFSIADLKKFNLYWNRPASELIFVTRSQHNKLHSDVRIKCGKNSIKKVRAKLTREILSKNGKKAAKIMNAKKTFEQRSKLAKGKLWWNNGTISRRSVECPGEGFVRGRLKGCADGH